MTFLQQEEYDKLMAAFAARRGNRAILEEEVTVLRQWAEGARIKGGILENILHGKVTVDVVAGEPVFAMTVEGSNYIETNPALFKALAEMKQVAPKAPEKSSEGPLEKQVLLLLALVNDRFPQGAEERLRVIAEVCGVSQEAVLLALDSLKRKGFVGQGGDVEGGE
jgi:hypothetical protein